ncbi:hypothetical protein [Paraoerskovia marina]|uniref:PH domain-containing protein n=1 Tax=Paraoerskovia marina TaxID=545619 RepID=A0A1H1SRL4_9CELL|nr:hypothetical protein [Paraoerskovia marina]SDS50565.1 hypothetical protein SAMN04489860_1700 [Paraoerskovia marina]
MNLPQPVAVAIWVVVGLVLVALVVRGFVRMRRRGVDTIGDLPGRPDDLGEIVLGAVDVTYVSSTLAGEALARVGVHHLGDRSRGTATVHENGVVVERSGSAPLYVGRSALEGVHITNGMVGKQLGTGTIVVLTWKAPATAPNDSITLDTGLHVRRTSDREQLIAAIDALVPSTIDGEETS